MTSTVLRAGVAIGLTIGGALAALDGCGGESATSPSVADDGTDGRGSSCGAPESVECGGPGFGPPSNPGACDVIEGDGGDGGRGVACIHVENPEAGPLAAVGHACVRPEACTGDSFACSASADCAGGRRCCANVAGEAIAARCSDACAEGEVELCSIREGDIDAGCAAGVCTHYRCSRFVTKALVACEKPVSCE